MTFPPYARRPALALLLLLGVPAAGAAQARAATQPAARCDRIRTTSFTFGRTGGNIRPQALRLQADGTVANVSTDPAAAVSPLHNVSRDVVAGLARLAWSGGFAALPARPARPSWNKDAAHEFIEIRSACGQHRVEWAGDGAPPAFRELWALLELVGGGAPA